MGGGYDHQQRVVAWTRAETVDGVVAVLECSSADWIVEAFPLLVSENRSTIKMHVHDSAAVKMWRTMSKIKKRKTL